MRTLGGAQCGGPLLFATGEFAACLLQCMQRLLPLRFEAARDKAVVRIDGAVMALGAPGVISGALDRQALLGQCAIMIGLQALGGA